MRERLELKPGDLLRYLFAGKRVAIEKANSGAEDYPFASFSEWANEADERAYKSL